MNGRDSPKKTLIGFLKGRFTSKGLGLVHLNQATSLWITLLNQIALHLSILSQALSPLQENKLCGIQAKGLKIRGDRGTGAAYG